MNHCVYREVYTRKVIWIFEFEGNVTRGGPQIKLKLLYDPKLKVLVGIELNPGPIISDEDDDKPALRLVHDPG